MREFKPASPRSHSYHEMKSPYPVRFTADAINHLAANPTRLKLEEWEWHEEIINGQTHCVITNRRTADA